jgi:hypothetical protein
VSSTTGYALQLNRVGYGPQAASLQPGTLHQMPLYWITYTEKARYGHAPFRPNHSVPADRYTVDGDWLEFQSTYGGMAKAVLRVRKLDVARIERIEEWKAEQRKERESAEYSAALRALPRKIVLSEEAEHGTPQSRIWPDFVRMRRQGLIVLEEGLPPAPEKLTHLDAVPVSYWSTDQNGAVQFIFFFESEESRVRPADTTLEFGRDSDGWYPVRSQLAWGGNYEDNIGSPDFMRHYGNEAIETSYSRTRSEPEPGTLAIIMSGRHAPNVEEIVLIQGARTEGRPASGHFGSWTICTETFAPLRVEAHDGAGRVLGSVEPHI